MEMELTPGGLWNIVGSVVILAFGLAVAMVKPRGRAQVWFGLFAVIFGVGTGLGNIYFPDPTWLNQVTLAMEAFGFMLAPIAVLGLVLSYAGWPDRPSSWWGTLVPGALMLAFVTAAFVLDPNGPRDVAAASGFPQSIFLEASFAGFYVYHAAVITGCLIFALWARQGDEARVRQAALLSSGLVFYTCWVYGSYSLLPIAFIRYTTAGFVIGLLLVATYWLMITRRGVAASAARNAALVPLAAALAGLLLNLQTAPWALGMSRILMTAILAYAIVRHKAFGIDAKLRFGISRGTVAAVFIAVFFVVSEAAQEFFGGALGSQYVGILAAGALVFAIAPLSRAADRIAEKAVPVTSRPGPSATRGLRLYEQLANRLAADGHFSPDDQRTLAHVAQEMGLGAGDVHDVLERVGAKK